MSGGQAPGKYSSLLRKTHKSSHVAMLQYTFTRIRPPCGKGRRVASLKPDHTILTHMMAQKRAAELMRGKQQLPGYT